MRVSQSGDPRNAQSLLHRSSHARHCGHAGRRNLPRSRRWNTDRLGRAVQKRKRAGLETPEALLRHVSLLGWGHIILTRKIQMA